MSENNNEEHAYRRSPRNKIEGLKKERRKVPSSGGGTGNLSKSTLKRRVKKTTKSKPQPGSQQKLKEDELMQEGKNIEESSHNLQVKKKEEGSQTNLGLDKTPSSARLVIESTLRKSAGILSDFTENTITKSRSIFSTILQPERFGITSSSGLNKNRSWYEPTPSIQCSVSISPRKKPDMSRLPQNIAELLKEDSSASVRERREICPSRPSSKKYHSKKMALKQYDDTSSKVDLPLVHIKSTSSTERKAPKIVVVSAPLKLFDIHHDRKEVRSPTPPPDNLYKRTNHIPIIQSIKDAIDKVPHNSSMFIKDQHHHHHQMDHTYKANGQSDQAPKINLGVEKGVAFVLGPKTKHPYINSFGGVKDTKWLKEAPSNCKWVINIGNFHDNEISFSLLDNNLTISGFRQPSLKYPEGQSVSESISIPTGFNINNMRIYRSNNANELLVLEEVVPNAAGHHIRGEE